MKHLISSIIAFLFRGKNFPSKRRVQSWSAWESCTEIKGTTVTSQDYSYVVFEDFILRFIYASCMLLRNHTAQQQWDYMLVVVTEYWVTYEFVFNSLDNYYMSVSIKKFWEDIWTAWQKHYFWASWDLIKIIFFSQIDKSRLKIITHLAEDSLKKERWDEYILVECKHFWYAAAQSALHSRLTEREVTPCF